MKTFWSNVAHALTTAAIWAAGHPQVVIDIATAAITKNPAALTKIPADLAK